jgi:amidohydrolase
MRPNLPALLTASLLAAPAFAQSSDAPTDIATAAQAVQKDVVAWRRDIHQHPELGNNEVRTAKLVADQLRKLGLQVRTGIAHTGVVAVLKGGEPGPRIALCADMDALPVTEQTGLPFASKVKTTYRGQDVGVMHACGHDAHVAILLGVATALAARKATLPGEVMFIFQPSEEGPPNPGETFGARLMLDEGVFRDFKPDAVFGLHVWAGLPVGQVGVRSGPMLAAADEWSLTVRGQQTHGSRPWDGVDPITVAAQILLGTQSLIARQVNIAATPAVLTAGQFNAGVRFNIIPDEARMVGTLRTFDAAQREDIITRFRRTAEDFAQFANTVPGVYFFVGSTAKGADPAKAPINHSPQFLLDESALDVGVRATLQVALDYLGAAR